MTRASMTGVLVREIVNFSAYWRSTTFSSTVEPTIYLLAFGFGFGSLVSQVAGLEYIEFVGTGVVATAVLFSSVFPGMFSTFVKYKLQRTYDAVLAAPVDVEELVTAEALWIAARAGTYGCVPLLLAMAFGLDPSPGMLIVPLIAFTAGFGWACFGVLIAARMKSFDNFNYVISAVLTPSSWWRARSSRSPRCPSSPACSRRSTRSTTACSSSAMRPSASSRAPTRSTSPRCWPSARWRGGQRWPRCADAYDRLTRLLVGLPLSARRQNLRSP